MACFINFCFIILNALTYISYGSGDEGLESERYLVLHSHRLGMANRLRTIADFYQVAVVTNRTLLLSWVPEVDCNISFTELFEDGPPQFKVLTQPLPREGASEAVGIMAAAAGLSYHRFDDKFDFLMDISVFKSDVDVVFSDYTGVVAIKGAPCQYYMTMHSRFYAALIPVKEVRDIVDQVMPLFRESIMVGVHVRMHNPRYDWEIVPPGPGDNRATAFGQHHATLHHFETMMASVSKTFGELTGGASSGESKPLYRFFIASNDAAAKAHLQRKFPNAVSLDSGNIDRSASDGMLVALVEWLTLSRSDLILHTYGSSFAQEASLINRRPLIGLWGGLGVHHYDAKLPFCGHTQFLRIGSSHGKDMTYEEGTFDNRQIAGKSLPLLPCPVMGAWGILNVYCNVNDD